MSRCKHGNKVGLGRHCRECHAETALTGRACPHGVVENDPVGGTTCAECMAEHYARRADRPASPTSLLSVRIPVDLHERIRCAASDRGVSTNWFVARLLSESMGRLAAEIVLTRETR